jgi:AraC-like DNA-binding protein
MIKTSGMRGDEWNYNPGSAIEMNQWSHIAGTYDGEFIKFYLNGELVDSKPTSGVINWDHRPSHLHIGAFKDFNEVHLFDGQIDEVRIWNATRSASEIKEFKNQKIDPAEEDLLAYYNFDKLNMDNGIIPDLSKHKLNGRLNIPANEETFAQSGAMIVPYVTQLDLVSSSSLKVSWETSESVHNYDFYMVDLAKDRSFQQIVASEKTMVNQFHFEDIPGGTILYLRVKGFSKEIGYTSYSDIQEIDEFRTGLSVIVTSLIDNQAHTNHKPITHNLLTSDYIGLPSQVRDVRLDFRLHNEIPENIRSGRILVKGPSKTYESAFSKSSDITLYNLKPGTYQVAIEWGSIDQDEALKTTFLMEIKPSFWQLGYLQIILGFILSFGIYLFTKNYTLIKKKSLHDLRKQLTPKDSIQEWIEPDVLEEKAQIIKDCIVANKLYLDPKFSLKALAEKVDIPHYQVSKILNDYYRSNFNDFINEFRVNEFVRLLNETDSSNIKNSALAYQCGFYSESTFFRAFKKFMGQSPQQYQKDLDKK